jgi:transcriptional antiterminator RfaH
MHWICVRLEQRRERVAKHFLQLAGYAVYIPYIRERIIRRHRRIERLTPLFPAYGFVGLIEHQGWYRARWTIGVAAILMGGDSPAKVPDDTLDIIRGRERNGAVELPRNGLKPGVKVRLLAGPFREHLAIYAGQSGIERVAVLLSLLGGERRITLARGDIEVEESA